MDAEKPWPLLIVGPVGAGKTCAGLLLCDVVGGRYHTVSSLRQRQVDAKMGRLYTDSYFSAAKVTEAEMWGEVQLSRLFVLDELAADPGAKEPERQMVQSVLDHREGKPLLLLSNRDPKEIAEIYGGPVGSRAAAGTILWHRGEDMREQTREVLS
ncbi:MAG: ATP-binding protein [Rhodobacteraceae bacterium]|nr:ATP-binding protein [Paracoccaceae bacterium]